MVPSDLSTINQRLLSSDFRSADQRSVCLDCDDAALVAQVEERAAHDITAHPFAAGATCASGRMYCADCTGLELDPIHQAAGLVCATHSSPIGPGDAECAWRLEYAEHDPRVCRVTIDGRNVGTPVR